MEIAAKLQMKSDHRLHCANCPPSLSPLATLAPQDPDGGRPALLVFVDDRRELEVLAPRIIASASRDDLTWVAYPKGGQRGTDLNRDVVVRRLEEGGVSPVRQVSLDEVWSALRFRPAP